MPEEVGVVALLPDQHEMRGGHEVCDERAALGRAREGIGSDTEPAAVVAVVVTFPKLLLGLEHLVREHDRTGPRLAELGTHGGTIASCPRLTAATSQSCCREAGSTVSSSSSAF